MSSRRHSRARNERRRGRSAGRCCHVSETRPTRAFGRPPAALALARRLPLGRTCERLPGPREAPARDDQEESERPADSCSHRAAIPVVRVRQTRRSQVVRSKRVRAPSTQARFHTRSGRPLRVGETTAPTRRWERDGRLNSQERRDKRCPATSSRNHVVVAVGGRVSAGGSYGRPAARWGWWAETRWRRRVLYVTRAPMCGVDRSASAGVGSGFDSSRSDRPGDVPVSQVENRSD
jgi:hypothetical protein